MTQANKEIKWVRHVIPTLDELWYDLNEAEISPKLDLNKGLHHSERDEDSYTTTFPTHAGLARFCILNFSNRNISWRT